MYILIPEGFIDKDKGDTSFFFLVGKYHAFADDTWGTICFLCPDIFKWKHIHPDPVECILKG